MTEVGLRELKSHLSQYVRQVRGGETVLVTDRGQVVAELVPPGTAGTQAPVPPGLAALAQRGAVALAQSGAPPAYPQLPPLLRPGRAQELLDEERGSA